MCLRWLRPRWKDALVLVKPATVSVIDTYLSTLPEADDRLSLPAQFGVFCSALIQFTSRHHLRYPIGDDYG
jgi:hypothetical protein